MKRAGKARLYPARRPDRSVGAAELRACKRAGEVQSRSRLHALGAKLDLHCGRRDSSAGIHLEPAWCRSAVPRPCLTLRTSSRLGSAEKSPLISAERASCLLRAAALEQARHVDVADRALLAP